ncbi:MAG: CCA tRNA nucleotidyltransferase [Anaerolineae bacterium]
MDSQVVISAEYLSGSSDTPLVERLLRWLPQVAQPCFLVGGAVRDCLLRSLPDLDHHLAIPTQTHDFDLAVPQGGISLARRLADEFGAAFYILDRERDIGRAVFGTMGRPDWRVVDVSAYQGTTLQEDLARRDFCINAMAVELTKQPLEIFDPLGGVNDLRVGRLRATSDRALSDDPVRTLRAVRLCAQFGFKIEPYTAAQIRAAAPHLCEVSPERVREEFMRILMLPNADTSLQQMDAFGLLDIVLPELTALKGLPQPGSSMDSFAHSIRVVHMMHRILASCQTALTEVLPYRECVTQHLATLVGDGYDRRALLILAALLHDVGKPSTLKRCEDGTIHYFGHEKMGTQLVKEILGRLRFSRQVSDWVMSIVRWHLRPLLLARETTVSRRALHRFFRDAGEAGVSVTLLALADCMAVDESSWHERKDKVLGTLEQLLEAYFERRDEIVTPPLLLSGNEIIHQLGITPGPLIGSLLQELQEAQAAGEVVTRAQAWEWVRTRLSASSQPKDS